MNDLDGGERTGRRELGWTLLVAAALVLAGPACDRRLAPFVAPEDEPPPIEGPIRIPGLGTPAPRSRVMAPPPAAAFIRGTIQVAEGTELPPGGVIFVIARAKADGPPVAVQRLAPGPFPMEFALARADTMGSGPIPKEVLLSARLDRDGDPMTRGSGDLVAESPDPLEVPISGVELVLAPRGVR